MLYAYPCAIEPDGDGGFLVVFPDVPEAITGGRGRSEAAAMAEDALATALGGYVRARRPIPAPSALASDQVVVAVPPVAAAKLALYTAMRDQRVTAADLAARLGVSEAVARKLADPDRHSPIGRVLEALRAVGRNLIVEDTAA